LILLSSGVWMVLTADAVVLLLFRIRADGLRVNAVAAE
jgi:hypothetical protein